MKKNLDFVCHLAELGSVNAVLFMSDIERKSELKQREIRWVFFLCSKLQIFTGYRGKVDAIVTPYLAQSLGAEFFFVMTRMIFSNKEAEK